jgi:hypothetical protein
LGAAAGGAVPASSISSTRGMKHNMCMLEHADT